MIEKLLQFECDVEAHFLENKNKTTKTSTKDEILTIKYTIRVFYQNNSYHKLLKQC